MTAAAESPIQWADPPRRAGRGSYNDDLIAFAAVLRSEPGRWAVYPRELTEGSGANTVTRINNGRVVAFGAGFESTQQRGVIYVRYIGDAS